jgi:mutator protein MutT
MESTLVRVVAAVIKHEGRLLVAQRPFGKRYGGLWEFPGGKCEPGESDAVALARELREEFGVQVTDVSAAAAEFHDPGSPYLIVFLPVIIRRQPECREHVAIRWATWSELASMSLAPTDRRFVDLQLSKLHQW